MTAAACAASPGWSPSCSPTRRPASATSYDDDPVRSARDTTWRRRVLMSDYNLITIPVVDDRR